MRRIERPLRRAPARSKVLAVLVTSLSVAIGYADETLPTEHILIKSVLITPAEEVEAPARAEGPLVTLNVQEGQWVERGKLLAAVDHQRLSLGVESAKHQLAKAAHDAENDLAVLLAQKKLELAVRELERLTAKVASVNGVISDAEVQRKRLAKDQAELELQQAERNQHAKRIEWDAQRTRVKEAELNLSQCQIPSILTGEVVEVLKRQGEWVRPGDPIVRLVRTDQVHAEGLVPVAVAAQHELSGRAARLTVQINGVPAHFRGRVTYVRNDVSSLKGQVRVRAEIDNPKQQLRPGMTGSLEINDH